MRYVIMENFRYENLVGKIQQLNSKIDILPNSGKSKYLRQIADDLYDVLGGNVTASGLYVTDIFLKLHKIADKFDKVTELEVLPDTTRRINSEIVKANNELLLAIEKDKDLFTIPEHLRKNKPNRLILKLIQKQGLRL